MGKYLVNEIRSAMNALRAGLKPVRDYHHDCVVDDNGLPCTNDMIIVIGDLEVSITHGLGGTIECQAGDYDISIFDEKGTDCWVHAPAIVQYIFAACLEAAKYHEMAAGMANATPVYWWENSNVERTDTEVRSWSFPA